MQPAYAPSRNDVAMSNKRWRQASIIMIANSPRAGSWPYALHRVTPLGSEETSMPSVPASGTWRRVATQLQPDIGVVVLQPFTGSLMTHRWREMDSNVRSRIDPPAEYEWASALSGQSLSILSSIADRFADRSVTCRGRITLTAFGGSLPS